MGEFYVPRTKGELIRWLYWQRPAWELKRMTKRQLCALYYQIIRAEAFKKEIKCPN